MNNHSLENPPILDMNNKSNTSSDEEGSSTGDDERTSDELDLQSEVVKLTEELSEARDKIAKLEKDMSIKNGKLAYSAEKTATIDILLEEKKELEERLAEIQQEEAQRASGHGDGRQPQGSGHINEEEMRKALRKEKHYENRLLEINQLLSSIKEENARLIRENDALRVIVNGPEEGIIKYEEEKKDSENDHPMEMNVAKLNDSMRGSKAEGVSKERMVNGLLSQLREANSAREALEKDLAAAKKSNYIMSKEMKRIQHEQQTQEMFQNTGHESLALSKKHISTLQKDLQKTRLELIEIKHNQACESLLTKQMQSQLKTSKLRLREASETIQSKDNRLLECKQMIEDYEVNIESLRAELLALSQTTDTYKNLPIDLDRNKEAVKKLLAIRDDRIFALSNECLENKIALQVECGKSKVLENEMTLVMKDLKEDRQENSLLFKELDVTRDDLRTSELQQLILENKFTESETSSRLLQCEMHELKVAMTSAEERYKGHILAREEMHSRLLERQAETNDIITRQESDIIKANLYCEELEHKVYQVETAKTRIEEDLVTCHQRIGDLLKNDNRSENTISRPNNSSIAEESLSPMSLQLDMLKNSNKVLAQKMEEATSSLSQTREALNEERRQHFEAITRAGVLQGEIDDSKKNMDSINSICQSYITAVEDKENIINELRNNLFHTRKELQSDINYRNRLSVSLKEEQNKVMYSENEIATLKSENDSLRSSKIEIINAYKSRANELEVIALQTSEDLSNERLSKKKLGQERLSLLRLIRDLKAESKVENENAERRKALHTKTEEVMYDGYSEDSEYNTKMQTEIDQVSSELSILRSTHMKETSSLNQENERLRKLIEEKNDTLASAHDIIESLNGELKVLHQSFNSFTSNGDEVEILSVAHKNTNEELWGEQQKLLYDALSSHAAERAANDLLQEQYDKWLANKDKTDPFSNHGTASNICNDSNKRISELESEICLLKRNLAKEKGSRDATESLLASFSENTTTQVEKKIRELRNELSKYKENNAKATEELKVTKENLESTRAKNVISTNLIAQLKTKVAQAEQFLGISVDMSASAGNSAKAEVAMKLDLESTRIERDKLKREIDRLKSITDGSDSSSSKDLKSKLECCQESEQRLKVKLDSVYKKLADEGAALVKSKKEAVEYANQLTQCQSENIRLNKNMEKLDAEFRLALQKLDGAQNLVNTNDEMRQQALISIEELSAQLKIEKDAKGELLVKMQQFTSTIQKKDVQIKQLQEAREEHLKRNGIISKLLQDSQNKEKNLEEEVKRLKSRNG